VPQQQRSRHAQDHLKLPRHRTRQERPQTNKHTHTHTHTPGVAQFEQHSTPASHLNCQPSDKTQHMQHRSPSPKKGKNPLKKTQSRRGLISLPNGLFTSGALACPISLLSHLLSPFTPLCGNLCRLLYPPSRHPLFPRNSPRCFMLVTNSRPFPRLTSFTLHPHPLFASRREYMTKRRPLETVFPLYVRIGVLFCGYGIGEFFGKGCCLFFG
jgi:hypothetical protein